MALSAPKYLLNSALMSQLPAYKWDDEPLDCKFEVPRLENDITAFFSRPILALASAMAEWVIWPLSNGKDPVFVDFLEACWAATMDRRYLRHASRKFAYRASDFYELPSNAGSAQDLWQPGELEDRVRGPQFVALYLLEQVVDLTLPNDCGAKETVYLSNLVEQVTKKAPAFKSWRKEIFKRWLEHHRLDLSDENLLGIPVPREAMDPAFPYDPSQAPGLIRAFLKGLDPSKNRFLTPAAEMTQLGFPGTPYEF
jgi:hypothetical protein